MPQIRRSSSSASVPVLRLDLVLCRPVSIVGVVLSLQSQLLLTGEGATLTYRAVTFSHCSCARHPLPIVGHNDSLLTRVEP
jgi:hypothetical protein